MPVRDTDTDTRIGTPAPPAHESDDDRYPVGRHCASRDRTVMADGGSPSDRDRPSHDLPDWMGDGPELYPDEATVRFPQLSAVQRDLLVVLAFEEPASCRTLSADGASGHVPGVDRTDLAETLRRLVDAGYVERRTSVDDGEVVYLLSSNGRLFIRRRAQRLIAAVDAL